MKNSGSKYLLTTNFTELKKNKNIRTGGWRMINLELTPFNFPKPKLIIKEGYFKDKYSDKSLCLWELEKIK
jgi:hypothetical protein